MTTGRPASIRIGELARRTGTSPELLRAWERRYGLVRPARTPGGFRLYSEEDARRVERMRAQLRLGLSAAQAAVVAIAEELPDARDGDELASQTARRELLQAVECYDEGSAQGYLDHLLATLTGPDVLTRVVLPVLRAIGERWEEGTLSVAQEHFASQLLRGRLLGLARGWDRGIGPRALLACPPGEEHDLGLIVFGLLLREEGWRVLLLGPDLPIAALARAAEEAAPAAIVLSAVAQERFAGITRELAALARPAILGLGGVGATPDVAAAAGALALPADQAAAAVLLTSEYDR